MGVLMSVGLRISLIMIMIVGTSIGMLALPDQARVGMAAHAAPNSPALIPQMLITVTTTDDDFAPANNTCSLREAVYAAVHDIAVDGCPAGAADDTVMIPAGTYVLSRTGNLEDGGFTGDLDITGTLHLTGATSATTILDGTQSDRLLEIFDGQVSLEHLTLRRGRSIWGGAVRFHRGALNVSHSTLYANAAWPDEQGVSYGGGILNEAGTLTVTHSLLTNNMAQNEHMGATGIGGGISAMSAAHTTIMTSTLANNWSSAVSNSGVLHVSDTLFSSNETGVGNNGTAYIKGSRFLDTGYNSAVGNAGTLTLDASEIAGTRISPYLFYCDEGGAVYAGPGTTTIKDSYIHDNQSHFGAGVYARGGQLNIIGSSIVDNASVDGDLGRDICLGQGAGVYAEQSTLSIVNSTIGNNQAHYNGAGIMAKQAQINLLNSTIAGNHNAMIVPGDGVSTIDGAGLLNDGATSSISLTNTLVAGNTSRATFDKTDCHGPITSLGYNLVGAPTANCTITGTLTGLLTNVDPLLGTLGDHGGATLTWDLYPNSPAIDAGSPDICPLTDQRGFPRPADGDGAAGPRCDIGAYERQPGDPELPTVTPSIIPTATAVAPPTATATATASVPPTATQGTPVTPTLTPTPTLTALPTGTPTQTVAPTALPTGAPTQTVAPTTRLYFPLLTR
jgi:CSLREA domain-containing protein